MTEEGEIPTPAEFLATLLLMTQERQEKFIEHVQNMTAIASRCDWGDHEGRIEALTHERNEALDRVRLLEESVKAAVDAYLKRQP